MSSPFNKTLLASTVSLIACMQAHASVVRDDVPYEDFRNFAENKGRFFVGAMGIEIKSKDGEVIGKILEGIPMPDFSSSASNTATITLIDPQYGVSVAHNDVGNINGLHSYYFPKFGGQSQMADAHRYKYRIVDANNDAYTDVNETPHQDYQAPRLNKLVTEVAPTPTIFQTPTSLKDITDTYTTFVRLGSGRQSVMDKGGTLHTNEKCFFDEAGDVLDSHCRQVASGYDFLTGGESFGYHELAEQEIDVADPNEPTKTISGYILTGLGKPPRDNEPQQMDLYTKVMASLGDKGDSGSPIFGYNKHTKRWELLSVLSGTTLWTTFDDRIYNTTRDNVIRPDFNADRANEDKHTLNANTATIYTLQEEGGKLVLKETGQTKVSFDAPMMVDMETGGILSELDKGKTLHFTGVKSELNLTGKIHQGAGALYFDSDFTVNGTNADDTWLGAGVSVAKDKTVTWNIKNPAGDRLSKVGAGTLHVKGQGDNQGDISVGDGLVILEQSGGKAFNEVGIVSGRGTVRLTSADQIDPDKLYFGYRGGRLDVNGNDLTFNYIQNTDEGAQIVNHNTSKVANITVTGKVNDIPNNSYELFEGKHYRLRGLNDGRNKPLNGQSNTDWVLYSENQEDKYAHWADYRKQIEALNLMSAFNGFLGEKDGSKPNGELNFIYNPAGKAGTDHTYGTLPTSKTTNPADHILLLSGGSNLNGDLTVKAGDVILSGRPTPYALDIQYENTGTPKDPKFVLKSKQEVFKDDDWINRSFKATNFKVSGGSLRVGRNVSELLGDITATGGSFVQLGYRGDMPVCIRSDYHGEVSCQPQTYGENVLKTIPITQATSNITLQDNAQLDMGKAHLKGVVKAEANTEFKMNEDATWTMKGDSELGKLSLSGGNIILNPASDPTNVSKYHTLKIGELLGVGGNFHYLTDFSSLKGDKVEVSGNATGVHKLYVKDSGREPQKNTEKLTLMTVGGTNSANITLGNVGGVVDVGALRYKLALKQADGGNSYYLHNPLMEKELQEAERKAKEEAERKAKEEAERKAKEEAERKQREAEEAERKAKEEAEQKAKEEAERKQREAEEAERKAKEEAEQKAKEETERKQREAEEAERKAKEEAERKAKEEAERKAKEEAERKAKEEAERKAKEEAERKAKEEAERKAKEEAERKAKEEAERKAKEEAERKAKEEAERKQREAEEAERKAKEEAERKQREAERKAKEEAEQKAKEEAERKQREAERKAKEEAEQKAKEEAERKQREAEQKAKEEAERKQREAEEAERKAKEEAERKAKEEAERKAKEEAERKKQADLISTYTNTALSELSSQANSLNHIGHGLERYVLADNGQDSASALGFIQYLSSGGQTSRVWLHTDYYREKAHRSDNYRQYKKDEKLVQMGTDTSFSVSRGTLTVGGAVSHSTVDNRFDGVMRGEADINMISVYGKYSTANLGFISFDTGFGRADNRIINQGQETRFDRSLISTALNVGKTFEIGSVQVQPSLGVRYHHLSGVNYELSGANVAVKDTDLLTYRAGVSLTKTFTTGNGTRIKPFIASNYLDSNRKHSEVVMNESYSFKQEFGRYTQHEAGLTIGKNLWDTSLTFSHADGNEINKQQSVGLRLNYRW